MVSSVICAMPVEVSFDCRSGRENKAMQLCNTTGRSFYVLRLNLSSEIERREETVADLNLNLEFAPPPVSTAAM